VKRIGICNFTTGMIRDLQAYASIAPQVLQVEMHPYLTQQRLLRYCQDENITVTAFSPFGASSIPLA
jgi:D-xylose reductase